MAISPIWKNLWFWWIEIIKLLIKFVISFPKCVTSLADSKTELPHYGLVLQQTPQTEWILKNVIIFIFVVIARTLVIRTRTLKSLGVHCGLCCRDKKTYFIFWLNFTLPPPCQHLYVTRDLFASSCLARPQFDVTCN